MSPVQSILGVGAKKAGHYCFSSMPVTPNQAPVKTWAGLGKVTQLLAPTCASRLTRETPVADPRGAAARTPYVPSAKDGGRDASQDDSAP